MSDQAADLNLLFGILANQLDFVDRDQLLEAMHLWVQDKSKSLGAVLVKQGWLSDQRHKLLDALVQEHLSEHEGDPARSLADVRPAGETLARLKDINDDELAQSLAPVAASAARSTQAPAHTPSQPPSQHDDILQTMAPDIAPVTASRFRTLRLHDQGGLGKVWVAEDTELHREVALKEIRGEYADDQAARARFILEAEVTGGLEHPGIVPVYGLGRYPDGRPYYAMRFIRGNSLRSCIAEFHRTDWKKEGVGQKTIALRRMLRCFLDVCNAIEYAHSRGILHRDLKPANVMLGEYGETLVVDWGLAKPAGDNEAAEPAEPSMREPLRPASMSISNPTVLGSALGSPSFMSPEQARGEHDKLGPQTDVYSLGATLYFLLANQAAFSGENYLEVLEKVKYGEWAPPRTIKPDVPRPLNAICVKAMQLDTEDRYPSAAELAQDLERYLADEPVLAYQEGPIERLMRLARRYRTVVRAAALALLAITVISMLAVFSINKQKLEAERARESTQRVIGYLVDAFESANPEQDGRNLKVADVLPRAQQKLETLEDQPLEQAELADAIGKTYYGLGLYEESVELHEKAYQIREKRLGADDPKTLESKNELALGYQGTGDLDRALPMLIETLDKRRTVLGESHEDTAESTSNLGVAYYHLAELDRAIPLLREALEWYLSERGEDDVDTIKIMLNLYSTYALKGDLDQAIEGLETTVGLANGNLGEMHPDTLQALNNLGFCYSKTNQTDQAIPLFERALDGRRNVLGEEHPETISTELDLASCYGQIERYDRALSLYLDAMKKTRALHGDNDPDLELALLQALPPSAEQALNLEDHGHDTDAASLRDTIDEALLLLEDGNRFLFHAEKIQRGTVLTQQGNHEEAERLLLEAATELRDRNDIPRSWQYRVILTYEHLIALYRLWNRPDEAEKWETQLDAIEEAKRRSEAPTEP